MLLSSQAAEDLELSLLLEAVSACYGYDFRLYARDSMARRVAAAAAKVGAKNLGELQHRLITEPTTFAAVLDVLTVRVTEMFRDPNVYSVIREQVLPVLRTYPELKIWHAGCASGEEVYATAILLSEAGLYERSHIYATDMSTAAVAQTREAVYPEVQLEEFRRNYRAAGGQRDFAEYFIRAYGSVAVVPELKRNVHVFQHDLVSDYSPGEMQLIFCRNVLIYFDQATKANIFERMSRMMEPDGVLALGAAESVVGITNTFKPYPERRGLYRPNIAPVIRVGASTMMPQTLRAVASAL
jgi:chemotaxis protein methyltransferase CheR